jgi:hypothetical protein
MNALRAELKQTIVPDTIEKLSHIAFKRPHRLRVISRELLGKRLETLNRPMHALSLAARVRIKYERSIETRHDDAADSVMQDAIAHARFCDVSPLRVANDEARVRTVLVSPTYQIGMKLQEMLLEMFREHERILLAHLPFLELAPCSKQIFF